MKDTLNKQRVIDTYNRLGKKIKAVKDAGASISEDVALNNNSELLFSLSHFLHRHQGELLIERHEAVRDALATITWFGVYSCALLETNAVQVYKALSVEDHKEIVTGSLDDLTKFIDKTIERRISDPNAWLALLTKVTMLTRTLNAVSDDLVAELQTRIKTMYP